MTGEEILIDVDVMVANNLIPAVKLRWATQIQRQCFRELPLDDEVYPFITIEGQRVYELPANCSLDNITSVMIGETEYYRPEDSDDPPYFFWSDVAGEFMINREPQGGLLGLISYKPTPEDITEENIQSSPMLPEDYHQLIVDGVAARVARSLGDERKASACEASFMLLLQKAKRDLKKPMPPIRVE